MLLLLLLVLALLYSPLAHPSRVYVTGVTGPSKARIERLLQQAGAGQSTLAVDREELLAAVQAFPEVADVRVQASPPSGLTLTAVMRLPVGVATVAGRRMVVAGDGRVLERASAADLPEIDASAGALQLRGSQLVGAGGALDVLAAAPHALLPMAKVLRTSTAGLEVEMRRGPRLIFGSAREARAKWIAAATVIADGSAAAASYIDVRVPSRPAVGGMGGSRVASALAPPVLTAPATQATRTTPPRPRAPRPLRLRRPAPLRHQPRRPPPPRAAQARRPDRRRRRCSRRPRLRASPPCQQSPKARWWRAAVRVPAAPRWTPGSRHPQGRLEPARRALQPTLQPSGTA